MKKNIYTTLLMLLITALQLHASGVSAFDTIDTTGCKALRQADYAKTLHVLRNETKVNDWAFWYFKKGIALNKLGSYDEACHCFSYCALHDSTLSLVAWEYMGDAETFAMRPMAAAQAYLNASKDSLSRERYCSIVVKLKSLVRSYPQLTDSLPELVRWKVDTTAVVKPVYVSPFKQLDSLAGAKDSGLLSISRYIALFIDTSSVNPCRLLEHIDSLHIPDTVISTSVLFKMSQCALQCKKNEMAEILLTTARRRPDFAAVVPEKAALHHEGMVAYQMKRYSESAQTLAYYITRFAMEQEAVFTIARSYRNSNDDTNALYWYRQFVQYYPQAQAASGVYWYLAWDYEQNGIYDTALYYYEQNGATDKKGVLTEASLYRIGLCYYKSGNMQSACSTFTRLRTLYPDASQGMGALYWKGMAVLSMRDTLEARKLLTSVVTTFPTEFYAYRARNMLLTLGDTLVFPAFDTTRNIDAVRSWLDSAGSSQRVPILLKDSVKYYVGAKLLTCGLAQVARAYLEPLELTYAGNLHFQFDLSFLYSAVDRTAESFRVARRLSQRIPVSRRTTTPLLLYNLSYPVHYFTTIKQTATADSVDPFLVLGVMRQESVFNAGIVSKAGAVGLLQLMPETAKTVARNLAERFSADSLKNPAANIRYGSHYLRKLLMQCNGDLITAIAGYNAGPSKAQLWQEKNKGKPFDLLVEDIGFDETRNYVKKVLANYWTYSALARFNRSPD